MKVFFFLEKLIKINKYDCEKLYISSRDTLNKGSRINVILFVILYTSIAFVLIDYS